jgi:putative membrane protein
MERPEYLMLLPWFRPYLTKSRLVIVLILLFHVVGLAGLAVPAYRNLFLSIVPFHLLLMFTLITINHEGSTDKKFALFVLSVFSAGLLVEWTGVHTAILFGHYAYGSTLGFKVSGIPLIIGINWMLLIYCTGIAVRQMKLQNGWIQATTGAALLVMLDYLIEPVAIKLNYWAWLHSTIPVYNYICWFLISALLLRLFSLFNFTRQNQVPVVFLFVQFAFFAALNFILN